MSYKTVFQNSEYRCTICPNRTFPKCHQVKTHLVEYHSGIGYVCPREGCDKIYRKRQTHQQCPVPPSEMQFFDERSGDVGKVAEEHLNLFKQHVLPTKWVEEHKRPNNYPGGLPPRAISPLPPDPEQLRPAMTYSRKKAEKRQRTNSKQETPSRDDKRPRTETSDEVDLGHDPMDITLLPGPSTSTSVLERHPDVHFDPPIQIESDENESIIMDIGDIMVTETNSDEQIPEIQSEITSEPKTEKQTNKEQISGTASKEQKVKSKDMERTVKKAKLTVKKYLEKTGAKPNNIVRKGGKTQPKYSKCGKAAKSSKTLKVKKNTGGEQTSDARKVNLKVSCETNLGDIREGENLHFTQSEVTIPGTLGRYLGDEDADPLPLESQPEVPLTFHMDKQECRLFIADNTRIRHPGSTQFLSAKTRETDVPINILENIRLSLLHHLQKTQEEAVVLRIGGKDFPTSMVTLRADPTSLLAVMLTAKSPFRPCAKKHFYLDRDPTHFRYILNYLRGGAHIESTTLPNDERSLMELLVEARFYMCVRLQEIVLAKLRKVTGSGALY